MQKNIVDFEHPTPRGILHPNIQLGVQKIMLCVFAFAFREVLEKVGHGVVGYYIAGGT